MGNVIKVKCNGPDKHVNEIDLDGVLRRTTVLRGALTKTGRDIPGRLVLPCQFCTAGKVVLDRKMIEENL